jgi:hypothetical protein
MVEAERERPATRARQHPAPVLEAAPPEVVALEPIRTEETALNDVLRTLEAQRQAAQARLAALQAQEQALLTTIKRITAALAALKGGRARAASTPADKPAAGGGGTPGYTREEVLPLLVSLLKKDSPLSEADLKARLSASAQQAGRSRTGLHLRVRDALKDARFQQSEQGWRLA